MANSSEKMYCPSCGEMVEFFVMLTEGDEIRHCSTCGLILQNEPTTEQKIKTLQTVMAAEDSAVLLKTLSNMMTDRKIAKNVIPCKNGEEFIAKSVENLKREQPVSMAILDVGMPILNGINAAVILRAVEKGYGRKRPVPILFFTAYKCDDTFKKVLKYCQPAKYINKGTGSSPEEFADRLYQVIYQLLTEQ